MAKSQSNWHTISPSRFAWEEEALRFVRERFPSHEPYRAWTNFEFVAHDGSVNEVDLLVITPMGFFLVEIKSRPGVIGGDQQHWTWDSGDGSLHGGDNPLLLANRKAKKLASLLRSQKAFTKSKTTCPFLEALVFCSAPDQTLKLEGAAANRVCLRDREESGKQSSKPGIMAAIINRDCPGVKQNVQKVSKPAARAVSRALEQLGYSLTQRKRKVGDYELESMVYESPSGTYQDWQAHHVSLKGAKRRVRIYGVGTATSQEERDLIAKAAQREAQLLESLQHENIIGADNYTNTEFGPALVYRFDPDLIRLDHYLLEEFKDMGIDERLSIIRQIAEALKFAHAKGVVHRSLAPQSIFISGKDAGSLVKIMNWQAGRLFAATTAMSCNTCSLHPDQLVEDRSLVYMAPEVLDGETDQCGAYMDIFSLGAITYHIFAGIAPASSLVELKTKLIEQKGLDLAAASDGTPEELRDLIQYSTHPNVADRCQSVEEFLQYLESVEEELTAPEEDVIENPLDAGKGDMLQGGFHVQKRLGKGGSAVAFLVKKGGKECVLKLANKPDNNERIEAEQQVLQGLQHQHIVGTFGKVQINGLSGFTMQPAGNETLAHRLRDQGPLQLEFLERFGEDLLDILRYLEERGTFHRDIKPENLGVGSTTGKGPLHVVLFDFSLSQTPVTNIHAGTQGYREPFLAARDDEPRWDLYAERYAAAITLYKMAVGLDAMPRWGDGQTPPEMLECEATIAPEVFDPSIREGMVRFFRKAFKRNPKERHDNAQLMLKDWRRVFNDARKSSTVHEAVDRNALIKDARLTTSVTQLGISASARQALERIDALTIEELLRIPFRVLQRLKGTGAETRSEIRTLVRALRKGRPDLVQAVEETETASVSTTDQVEELPVDVAPEKVSIDVIAKAVGALKGKGRDEEREFLNTYLCLERTNESKEWLSIAAVCRQLKLTKNSGWGYIEKARQRWSRIPYVTHLADDVAGIIERFGGVLAMSDLRTAILTARGSVESGGSREQVANAALRAVLEIERSREQPRFTEYRQGQVLLVAQAPEFGDYAMRLGKKADELAAADPLLHPGRALEILRQEPLPQDADPIPNNHDLLRLAVAASNTAAVSGRQELYPSGMDPMRALRLAQGTLCGLRELTIEAIRERVHGRYPEAKPIPGRPQIDEYLADLGFDVFWSPGAAQGKGAFEFRHGETWTLTSSGSTGSATGTTPGASLSREEIDIRLFERKLSQASRNGAFLVLNAPLKHLGKAQKRLCDAFDLEILDMDAALIKTMQSTAKAKKVNWNLVLQADANPNSADWKRLQRLVGLAVPEVEKEIESSGKTLLLCNAGLLGRYNQMDMLQRLMNRVGARGGDALHGVWLLIPEDEQHARPVIDGKPVPVLSSGQYTQVPRQWLA